MSVADRFAEYIAELHELSDSHRLPHGEPKDLPRLLEAFKSSEIFAIDFGCAIRSIAIREHFNASETELLTLVAIAWAGTQPDTSTSQLSQDIQELRGILHKSLAQKVLGHRPEGSMSASSGFPDEIQDLSSDSSNITQEFKSTDPGEEWKPQRFTLRESRQTPSHADDQSVSVGRERPTQRPTPRSEDGGLQTFEPHPSSRSVTPQGSGNRRMPGKEDRRKSDRRRSSDATRENLRARRLEPSATEVLAMGLVGLMSALLFSVGSLPIYRARVSVYLPSAIAGGKDPKANASGASPGVLHSGSRGESLLNGGLTEKVTQSLLAQPHSAAILRQDVLSRTMRDLHLGGNETILYADLVAETAREVKVTHLPPQDLYEVTCESWSAQFAALFCNQLTDSLIDQPSAATPSPEGAEPARIVDAASQPGSPVYPHWYVQGFAGLAGGCLIGVLLGFVKRKKLKPVRGNDLST